MTTTPETETETIVRVTIGEFTRPHGEGPHAIVIGREELAARSGLPQAEAVKAAERLARRGVVARDRYSDGKVYYMRRQEA